jgi:hypothetical protein
MKMSHSKGFILMKWWEFNKGHFVQGPALFFRVDFYSLRQQNKDGVVLEECL